MASYIFRLSGQYKRIACKYGRSRSFSGRKFCSLDETQPMLRQRHVGDDLRIEQGNRVARRRIAKRRRKTLGDSRAARDAAPFEHGYAQARLCQIEGQTNPLWPPPMMTMSICSLLKGCPNSISADVLATL